MATDPFPRPPAGVGTSVHVAASSSTDDERWHAWQAKGAAHDRAVRRRLAIVVPFVLVAAALLYALVVR
jgi:hypothetical protein